ncbi:MAG: hypothetical protein LBK63_11700 [Treponema sp.]|nr:hypothetical protein [Treponema sp.]
MSRLLLTLLLLCSSLAAAAAQTFKPFTALRVIRTERFDIIFPPESERTARTLAAKADGIYDRVSGLLGISLERRVPVSITPHTEKFNGYMLAVPYPHIVLYDTPMDLNMTVYANNLEGLFLHELTHAISLSSRQGYFQTWHAIFGGWVYPTALNTPSFMVEGVTVSFESLDGFGRANDPLVKQQLLQDMHEGVFLTPFQAAGVSEYPNNRAAYYEYGGLFSAWLQRTYGIERYARLWQAMGKDSHFSLFFYNYGFFNIFKNLYGMDFLTAWETFGDSLWEDLLDGGTLEENPLEPAYTGVVPGPSFAPGEGAVIPAVSSGGLGGDDRVFFLDTLAQAVLSYDSASGELRRCVSTDSSAYGLDVSAANGKLLVSSYRRYFSSLDRAVVTEYTLKGRKTGRVHRGLYHGRYFRDGVIGLSADLHNNNLVFRRDGEEQLLLRGREDLLYSDPSAINDVWISFVAAKKGYRELCLYNFETEQVYTLVSDLPDQDDRDRWRYIRSAQVSPGYLLFAYNQGQGMYKLGAVDISGITGDAIPPALEAVFTGRDFSGGVSRPVAAGGAIYYRGAFSKFDALLRYPESPATLPGIRVPLTLQPWAEEDAAFALPGASEPPWGGQYDLPPDPLPAKRYLGISYMNPFKFWLPLPLIRIAGNGISVDGGGLFSLMVDPTDTNIVQLNINFDARSPMAAGSVIWQNYALGFPLQFSFSDDLDKTGDTHYRITQASLMGTLSFGLGNDRTHFDVLPEMKGVFVSPDSGDHSSPYSWDYDEYHYSVGLGMGISSLVRPSWALFGQGLSLHGYARFQLDRDGPYRFSSTPRLDGVFSAAAEPWLPLRLHIYGAWDENGMDLHGRSGSYLEAAPDSAVPVEYPRQPHIPLKWLAGGEAELKLFSLDIQKNLSHLYYKRIFSSLAWRGTLYDDQGLEDGKGNSAEGTYLGNSPGGFYRLAQSLTLRLGLVIATVIIPAVPFSITPYGWGAWKFPNIRDDNGNNDFSFGIGFSVSY